MSKRINSRKASQRHAITRSCKRLNLYGRNLRYEALEDRRLLAVVTVTTLGDTINFSDGVTSLREAIFATNTVPGTDTITFAPSLTAGGPATLLLTQGELAITDALTIVGPGANLLNIDASGNDPTPTLKDGQGSRVFNIDDGTSAVVDVAISGLTIKGGDASGQGGGVNSSENLSIIDSVVSGNGAIGKGGGIYGKIGSLSITNSVITGNAAKTNGTVIGRGGGVYSAGSINIYGTTISGNSAGLNGGALFATGDADLENCMITNNQSSSSGGGIYGGNSSMSPKALTIRNSSISNNNVSGGEGGGIRMRYGTLLIEHTTISGNKANHGGGMSIADNINAQISDSTVSGNSVTASFPSSPTGYGAGILLVIGNLTVTGSVISDNTGAMLGGGIYDRSGQVTVRSSSIRGNSAANGGGIYGTATGAIVLDSSTVNGNSATMGGGIFNNSGLQPASSSVIVNSTISSNSATMQGGGIFNSGGLLTIESSTITNNSAPSGKGSGISAVAPLRGAGAPYDVQSSIIAGNINSDADVPATLLHSFGYNLIGTGSAVVIFNQPGDQTGVTNPLLGPLANNGGPTQTHALLAGSPAINSGDSAASAGVSGVPVNDQRGAPFTRVFGGRIDIGAFEFQPVGGLAGDFNRNGVVDARDYVLGRKQSGSTVVPASGADANGDGKVNDADLVVWRSNFGAAHDAGTGSAAQQLSVAELATKSSVASGQVAPALQMMPKSVFGLLGDSPRLPLELGADVLPVANRKSLTPLLRRSTTNDGVARIDLEIEAWLTTRAGYDGNDSTEARPPKLNLANCTSHAVQRQTSLVAAVDDALAVL